MQQQQHQNPPHQHQHHPQLANNTPPHLQVANQISSAQNFLLNAPKPISSAGIACTPLSMLQLPSQSYIPPLPANTFTTTSPPMSFVESKLTYAPPALVSSSSSSSTQSTSQMQLQQQQLQQQQQQLQLQQPGREFDVNMSLISDISKPVSIFFRTL